MKYLHILTAVLLTTLCLNVCAQQVTVHGVRSSLERAQSGEFSGRAEWNALTYYLQGVVEGAAAYHEGLENLDRTQLFCPPSGKGYSVEEMLNIFEKTSDRDADRPASLVLIESYARKYPCE